MNESKLQLEKLTDVCEPRVALQGGVCLNKSHVQHVPGKIAVAVQKQLFVLCMVLILQKCPLVWGLILLN